MIANVQEISSAHVDVIPPLESKRSIDYVPLEVLNKFKITYNKTSAVLPEKAKKENIKLEMGKISPNGEM